MSFRGDIASLPLGDVMQNLVAHRKTGTLIVETGKKTCYVQTEDGAIISFRDDEQLSISEWLTMKGFVEEEDMEEAMRRFRRTKKKTLGAILNDLGVLDISEYRRHLKCLVEEGLYELFSAEEGSFDFREGDLSQQYACRNVRGSKMKLAVSGIIMEAARRSDEWSNIRRHMPSENEIYFIPPRKRDELLKREEDELTAAAIELLDGTCTLKEVIRYMPCTRFEASLRLAEMIGSKKARPLDSAHVVERTGGEENPEQAIACLQTILEREPNNQDVLKRLAQLCEQEDKRAEAAKYLKILAVSCLDVDDVAAAQEYFKKSLKLNPKDLVTWQRLWDCVRRGSDKEKVLAFGKQYVKHFKKLGLMEMVRDHLLELARLFPGDESIRIELAHTRFALGEHKAAVQELIEVGQAALRQNRYADAEALLSRAIKYDHQNKKAKELLRRLRSGKLQRRRAMRRRLIRQGVVLLYLIAAVIFVFREMRFQSELMGITRTALAESVMKAEQRKEAVVRIKNLLKRYPYSISGSLDGPLLIEVLEKKGSKAGYDPQLPLGGPGSATAAFDE